MTLIISLPWNLLLNSRHMCPTAYLKASLENLLGISKLSWPKLNAVSSPENLLFLKSFSSHLQEIWPFQQVPAKSLVTSQSPSLSCIIHPTHTYNFKIHLNFNLSWSHPITSSATTHCGCAIIISCRDYCSNSVKTFPVSILMDCLGWGPKSRSGARISVDTIEEVINPGEHCRAWLREKGKGKSQ